MTKILFICHGNICRSVAAEMVMRALAPGWAVASAATTAEELGNDIYPPMRKVLTERSIPMVHHCARMTRTSDYDKYDYIIGMDEENRADLLRIYHGDPAGKISLLMEWAGESREVSDPWYTRDFNRALNDIERGCRALRNKLSGCADGHGSV